jgi:F0F1-type ATP synthase assembly protein I
VAPRKEITTSEGLRVGLVLLGTVTSVLLLTTVVGLLLQRTLGFGPIAFAICIVMGVLAATIIVLLRVVKELK